jgi:hypothetical protein
MTWNAFESFLMINALPMINLIVLLLVILKQQEQERRINQLYERRTTPRKDTSHDAGQYR